MAKVSEPAAPNVAFWHEADVRGPPINVRFRG